MSECTRSSITSLRVSVLALIAAAALGACSAEAPASSDADRTLRIAVAKFQHETCTFCPGGDTEIADWIRVRPPFDDEALFESGDFVRGFTARAREYGNVELLPLRSPEGVFGGSSRSWNSEETFEHFAGMIIEDLRSAMPVDGVYLALHGAMAVRNVPRPEAELARRVREIVGPDVPIAGSFDLHGNEDEEFLRWADFSFVTKRYPHYDAYIQGERSARMIISTARGGYSPTPATRKPGIITPTVVQWTGQSPSMDIMERARRWESREPDVYVSVFSGYPWSDVPDVGATVQVMTNDDQPLADAIADDMNDFMWRMREEFAAGKYPLPDEAAQIVRDAIQAGEVPVAVGDYSDRPGDATHILKAFEAAGIGRVLHGAISDPSVIEALENVDAEAGAAFDMDVGGFTPSGGTPARITGTLEYFGAGLGYEGVAAVSFGDGNLVFISPAYSQVLYPEDFRLGSIDPDDYDVFVVKSRVHFRRGFDETGYARTILVVEAPGPFVGTTFLDALPYEHVVLEDLYPYAGKQPTRNP